MTSLGMSPRVATAAGTAEAGDDEPAQGAEAVAPHATHRLRDLSREGRVLAAAVGLALVVPHLVAVVKFGRSWVPAGDVALMGVRVLDVFSGRAPLLGQPSTSGLYGGFERHAFHPGPMQFFLTAPFARAVGVTYAMLAVALAVTASSVLVAAWAVFRQLGAWAGLVAAVALGAVTFTTGSSSLVNPISSNVAGYPLLAGAVLAWCLLCGDDRLLPLTVAYLSFAGQAHLAVGPSVAILAAAGLVGVGLTWWRADVRHDAVARRHALRWGGAGLLVGAVLWAPVLYQQLTGDPGNATALAEFASDGGRPSVGPAAAARQVARVVGLPPLVGRTDLDGFDLLAPVAPGTWLTAALVLGVLAVAGFRWRHRAPARTALVATVGVLVVCGLANGASVPDSVERARLAFYHWAWPLVVLVTVGLALVAAEVARRVAGARWPVGAPEPAPGRRRAARIGLAGVVLGAIAVPALMNPSLDRPTNLVSRTGTSYPRPVLSSLESQLAAAGVDDIDGPVVVLPRGAGVFDGTAEGLALQLMERGVDVAFPAGYRDFVDDEHLAAGDEPAVLVLVSEGVDGPPARVPGREVARVPVAPDLDRRAFEELVATAEGVRPDDVVGGPEYRDLYAGLGQNDRRVFDATIERVFAEPRRWFADQEIVRFFLDYPVESPQFDRQALRRLDASFPGGFEGGPPAIALSVWLATGEEATAALRAAGAEPAGGAGAGGPGGQGAPPG